MLEAVRELTYPLGFGTFDRFVNPPRARRSKRSTQEGGEITVRASVEMILKGGREYQLVKEPLLRTTTRGVNGLLVVSRYLLIDARRQGPQGRQDALGGGRAVHHQASRSDLPPGEYAVIVGIFLDGNALQPSARIVTCASARLMR